MNNEYKVHRNHNVYILGAGFSRDAGLPLIYDFLDQMRLVDEGTDEELESINQVFKFRLEAAGAAYRSPIEVENIEELFSLASARERDFDDNHIPKAIAATLHYAKNKHRNRAPYYAEDINVPTVQPANTWTQIEHSGRVGFKTYRIPAYDYYAGIVSGALCEAAPESRNTVITFNYDTLLEEGLENLQVPYNYQLPINGADYNESATHIVGRLFAEQAL
jgi:hypothetical protein